MESVVGSAAPLFGAIFMCNQKTKKECLKKKLFGLPHSQSLFLAKIKAGMLLFLFEYEERKLYGVFQASSNGAMNIIPHAFMSSGSKFPAQVRINTIWYCDPLSEHAFYDAIKDNYYTSQKFHFGLSENQVYKLLCLFSTRKVGIQKSQNLFPGKISESLSRSFDSGRFGVSNESSIPTEYTGNKLRIGKELLKYLSVSSSNQTLLGSSENLNLEGDDAIVDGQHRLSSIEPSNIPHSSSQRDLDNEHGHSHSHDICKPNTSNFRLRSSSFDDKRSAHSERSADIFFPSSRSQTDPSHEANNLKVSSVKPHSLDISAGTEDYIPLTYLDHLEPNADFIPLTLENHYDASTSSVLLPETSYSRNKSVFPTNLEDYKGLSFPESASMAFLRHGSFGRESMSSSFNQGNGPSCDPTIPLGYGVEGSHYLDYEPRSAILGESYLPVDGYPENHNFMNRLEQDSLTEIDKNDYLVKMGLHSDTQKNRTSVFSRLTMTHKFSEPAEENEVETSVNQLMDALYLCQKHWMGSTKKLDHHIQVKDDGCLKFEHTQKKFEVTACASDEQLDINDMIVENVKAPISFKRRSEGQKLQGKIGGYSEQTEGSVGTHKRRKLVRPSFDVGEKQEIGFTDNLHGSEKEIDCKGNSISGDSSDGTGNSETGPSQNFGADIVVCPGGFGEDSAKLKEASSSQDFKVKVEAFVQELVGIQNCSLSREGSSQDANMCHQGDSGTSKEGTGSAHREAVDALMKNSDAPLKEAFDMSVKFQDDGKTKDVSLESHPDEKAEVANEKVVAESIGFSLELLSTGKVEENIDISVKSADENEKECV